MDQHLEQIVITKAVSAFRLLHSPVGMIVERRSRPRWGLVLKTQGRTVYTCGGVETVSDLHHPVLLPAGSCYKWICTDPGECLMMEFDALTEYDRLISFEVKDLSFIKNAFSRLEKALRAPDDEREIECKSILYGLLSVLLRQGKREYLPRATENRVLPAAQYVAEHYDDPALTNQKLAALCRLSVPYFRKTFFRVYGSSPIRYLNGLRMEKAKAILQSDYGTVAQVAESVGYRSIYHFSKMFRAYTGTSPSAFAREAKLFQQEK